MGVDGIVVAREVSITPQPSSEWELVVSTEEGNVVSSAQRAVLARALGHLNRFAA